MNKKFLEKQDLIAMLEAEGADKQLLFERSREITDQYIGKKVHLRGLIEYSNVCIKDCYYCGIRKSNKDQHRYTLSNEEVIRCAQFALEHQYGSLVIQAGERCDAAFTSRITELLKEIKRISQGKLGITLSLGEQSEEIYDEWFNAGGHRYLLRIESSNRELYKRIHPHNDLHSFDNRLKALHNIRKAGFQLGTGVMIGLPLQTIGDLADDLLFLREMDVDMVGMGPYVEHRATPLYAEEGLLYSRQQRLDLAFKMIAALRIMMKNINIAAATALQAIDPVGREKAIRYGANILMPNIGPGDYRNSYKLYEDKPCLDESPAECTRCLDIRVGMTGSSIEYNEWGDSKHFAMKR
ncbi:MAG: [FeFe] hydrogenase H-cluster radical SAM maturase HydE [Flavobacteriaceae bacterium]|nr:[FeFe] hydrogenase H-cluster radical SAM maturase HydE [Flavobacteriaceae bacterium]